MSRTVPEWIGKTDDAAIPARVKLRIYDAAKGRCVACTQTASAYDCDHVIPLILGGEHRESNLQLLCKPCHKRKTKLDVKLKAKVARVRSRHLGISRKGPKIPSRGFAKRPPQNTASRPIERKHVGGI